MLALNCLHYISYLRYLASLTLMKVQNLPEQALIITVFIIHILKWEKMIELLETHLIRMHFLK